MNSMMKEMCQNMMKNMGKSGMMEMCQNMMENMNMEDMKRDDNQKMAEMCNMMKKGDFNPQEFCKNFMGTGHKKHRQ